MNGNTNASEGRGCLTFIACHFGEWPARRVAKGYLWTRVRTDFGGMTKSEYYTLNPCSGGGVADEKTYYVYILASNSRVLYVGMTGDLCHRIYQHKHKLLDGFTKRYNVDKLVYYEETNDVWEAIQREKQIKKWRREKKIALIETVNAGCRDLYDKLCGDCE